MKKVLLITAYLFVITSTSALAGSGEVSKKDYNNFIKHFYAYIKVDASLITCQGTKIIKFQDYLNHNSYYFKILRKVEAAAKANGWPELDNMLRLKAIDDGVEHMKVAIARAKLGEKSNVIQQCEKALAYVVHVD